MHALCQECHCLAVALTQQLYTVLQTKLLLPSEAPFYMHSSIAFAFVIMRQRWFKVNSNVASLVGNRYPDFAL